MGTKQIEVGSPGHVWSFVASANVTSGQVVYFDGGKVRPTSAASQHVAGVALIPASAGKPVSVIMEGIVKVKASSASVIAGDLLGGFAAGTLYERTWSGDNERRLDAGVALETIAAGNKGLVKLLW